MGQNLGPVVFLAGVTSAVSLGVREDYMIKNRRTVIIAGATVLVLVAGGGAAYAASVSIPDSSGVIHGCYKPTGNGSASTLGVIDTALPGGTCPKGQTALSWNQTGPQGPAGATGPAGPPRTLATMTVFQTGAPVDPGQSGSVKAICPAGWVATGGGWNQQNGGADGLVIQTSQPIGGTPAIGWGVGGWNTTGNQSPGLTAWVICEQLQ